MPGGDEGRNHQDSRTQSDTKAKTGERKHQGTKTQSRRSVGAALVAARDRDSRFPARQEGQGRGGHRSPEAGDQAGAQEVSLLSLWQDARRSLADLVDIVLMVPGALTGWEWTISRFESQDRLHPPLPGAIVFTGSSSITFWKTLEQDMAPLRAINRGFGGSKIDQVARFVDRIVIPDRPRAVVLFAGTNDIAGPKPKTAEQVFQGYLAFVEKVRAALPEVPVYYISITPAPSRWKLWPIARAANELIRAYASAHRHLHFIDLTRRHPGTQRRARSQPVSNRQAPPQQAGLRQMDRRHQTGPAGGSLIDRSGVRAPGRQAGAMRSADRFAPLRRAHGAGCGIRPFPQAPRLAGSWCRVRHEGREHTATKS